VPDLTILSLGAGVQSSTLLWLADAGLVTPRPDYAVFADTQSEPPWVYETLEYMKAHSSIPIRVATAGNLGEALKIGNNSTGGRFASVPFWTVGEDGREAPTRRQCSREYKIDVVRKEARTLLGLEPGQRAAGKFEVEMWIGISVDEAQRAKPSRHSWITHRWPLLFDHPMRRGECLAWMKAQGHPIPKKSACTFCPMRPALEYAHWRDDEPELFEEACEFDDLIRNTNSGRQRGMMHEQFILRTLKPLRELPPTVELEKDDRNQIELFANSCDSGMCGV
jgi:hypothetical protein